MPKTLILAILLALILAPEGQILASEGGLTPNATNYLAKFGFIKTIVIDVPLKIFKFVGELILLPLANLNLSLSLQIAQETAQKASSGSIKAKIDQISQEIISQTETNFKNFAESIKSLFK